MIVYYSQTSIFDYRVRVGSLSFWINSFFLCEFWAFINNSYGKTISRELCFCLCSESAESVAWLWLGVVRCLRKNENSLFPCFFYSGSVRWVTCAQLICIKFIINLLNSDGLSMIWYRVIISCWGLSWIVSKCLK